MHGAHIPNLVGAWFVAASAGGLHSKGHPQACVVAGPIPFMPGHGMMQDLEAPYPCWGCGWACMTSPPSCSQSSACRVLAAGACQYLCAPNIPPHAHKMGEGNFSTATFTLPPRRYPTCSAL